MADTLAARTVRGLKWSYLSTLANAVLQIGLAAILARLVTPAAFGLIAMSAFALRFGQYFAQMGLGSALVQKPELDSREIRASFWVSLGLGLAFFALFWLSAPLLSSLFREPDLIPVVRAMAAGFPLTGASTTALALLRREMRFKAVAIVDVGSYVIGYALVGVPLAWMGYGVWALVVASLVQSTLNALGYYAVVRHRIRPIFAGDAYGPLLHFGSRVSVIGFLEFLGSNIDTLGVGRLLGAAPLGFYNRSLNLANLPLQYISTALSRVMLPSMSRIARDDARVREVYCDGLMVLGALVLPIGWAVAADAGDVVLLLLGPRWASVIPLLHVVGIAAPVTAVTHLGEVLMEARGALRSKLIIRSVHLVGFATALVLAARFGVMGFAVVFTASELALHVAYTVAVSRETNIPVRALVASYAPGILYGLVTSATVYVVYIGGITAGIPLAARLTLEIALAAVVLALLVLRAFRGRVWWILAEYVGSSADEGRMARLSRFLARFAFPKGGS